MSRVDVNGVGIEYQVTGQGRPVVLLHGFPDSGRLWRHQVTALAEAGFQVIVPDLRGYGHSDKPDSAQNVAGPWRYERLDGPGHWLQLEAPDKINALQLDFLPR